MEIATYNKKSKNKEEITVVNLAFVKIEIITQNPLAE